MTNDPGAECNIGTHVRLATTILTSKVWNVTRRATEQTDDDNFCQNQVTKSSSLPRQLNTLPLSEKRGSSVLQIYFATPPRSNRCQSIPILHLSLRFLNEILSSCTGHWNLVAKFYVILSLICSGPTLAPTFYHQICPPLSVGWLRGPWRRISKGVTISSFLK